MHASRPRLFIDHPIYEQLIWATTQNIEVLARLEWMPNIVNWTVAGLEAAMFAGLPQHGPHAIAGANDFGTAWLNRHTLRKSQMHEK